MDGWCYLLRWLRRRGVELSFFSLGIVEFEIFVRFRVET